MARPWQLDIRWQCSRCVRTLDVTVELRHQAGADSKAACPYCDAVLRQERRPGLIVSIGKRE